MDLAYPHLHMLKDNPPKNYRINLKKNAPKAVIFFIAAEMA